MTGRKRMRRMLACILAVMLLLAGCGEKKPGSASTPPAEKPPVETPPVIQGGDQQPDGSQKEDVPEPVPSAAYLEVPLRHYEEHDGWGTALEVPQIQGEENDVIRTINAELNERFQEWKTTYSVVDIVWAEALAYPTETDRYLNAVISFCEYPTYGTYGQVYSRVYDKESRKVVLLGDALAMASIREEGLLKAFRDWITAQGVADGASAQLESLAFRMLPDGTPQFLAGVRVTSEFGDSWTSFYTWANGEIGWPCSVPVEPAEITGVFEAGPLRCQQTEYGTDGVYLDWEGVSEGTWPFAVTLETIQFHGHDDPELEAVNSALRMEADVQREYYENALNKGEDRCRADGNTWASLWAYPITAERYLNALTVVRNHMQFRVDTANTWNLVTGVVYDREEKRTLTREDAFSLANVTERDVLKDVEAFCARQEIGVFEDLSSLFFYMEPDGNPVFIIGGVVRMTETALGWPTFFNWNQGEIYWSGEEPVPLYLVDTQRDGLSCLQGMWQYDGAAIISLQEAFETLREIVEVQEYLAGGMEMMDDGTTVWLNSEEYRCFVLGTRDNNGVFTAKHRYAVSFRSVYRMDTQLNDWVPVGFG